jgi:signal transduction histidine kinase
MGDVTVEPSAAHRLRHELNNQLLIILGFSELLLEALPHRDSRRTDVEKLETAARAAVRLVSESPLLR